MYKIASSIVVVLILIGCKKDHDEDIDCALFDPGFEQFYIDLVDIDGNNLIENGTYNKNTIKVFYKDEEFGGVINYGSMGPLIRFPVVGKGNTNFEIHLSDTETDMLQLNVSSTNGPCGFTFYTAHSASYNGAQQVLEELDAFSKKITVQK